MEKSEKKQIAALRKLYRPGRLDTIANVKTFMASMIRKSARGEIESSEGYRLVMMASILRDTIIVEKVEGDVRELEKRLDQSGTAGSLIKVVPFAAGAKAK